MTSTQTTQGFVRNENSYNLAQTHYIKLGGTSNVCFVIFWVILMQGKIWAPQV